MQATTPMRAGPCRSTALGRQAGGVAWRAGAQQALFFRAAAPPPTHRQLQTRRAPAPPACADAAAAGASVPDPAPSPQQHAPKRRLRRTSLLWLAGGLVAAAALGCAHVALNAGSTLPLITAARAQLAGSALAQSGFFAAFSLIFLSEIGDKTFFIAALLAMRLGKWVSWVGSTASLALMTMISVAIGYAVKSVPAVVESSELLGQWLGAALLFYFGVRTLRDAWVQPADSDAGEELEEAEASVSQAEQGGKISTEQTPWQALFEVASLIFVAEWGDRSMLATIALGAAQGPLGVAGGAIAAHAAATLLAVAGGAALSSHISERMVGLIGGSLFLIFSLATVVGLF